MALNLTCRTLDGARQANAELIKALNVFQIDGLNCAANLSIPIPAAVRATQPPPSDVWWSDVQKIIPPVSWYALVVDVFGSEPTHVGSSSSSSSLVASEWTHEVFELRKKVSFFFAELASASVERDGNEDIKQHLHRTFGPRGPSAVAAGVGSPAAASGASLVDVLLDSLLLRGCTAAGSLLRCLWSRVPSTLAATMTPRPTTVAFTKTVLGRLLTSRIEGLRVVAATDDNNNASMDGTVAVEVWRCIHVLIMANGTVTSECMRSYIIDVTRRFCRLLSHNPSSATAFAEEDEGHTVTTTPTPPQPGHVTPPPSPQTEPKPSPQVATTSCRFLNQWQTLRILTSLLGETKFGKLRTMLAESPAILCAVLQFVQSPSTHLRFEAYHCVKVFVAKPNKPPPMRYLMWINRDVLLKFIAAHHQNVVQQFEGDDPRRNPMNAAGGGGGDLVEEAEEREREREMLQDRLIHLQPLSREETLLLLKE